MKQMMWNSAPKHSRPKKKRGDTHISVVTGGEYIKFDVRYSGINRRRRCSPLVVEFFDSFLDAVLDRIASLFDEIAYLRRWVIDVEHTVVDGNGDRDGE